MRFSLSQLLKAKNIIKNKKVKILFFKNGKYYLKVKDYSVILDFKKKKETCNCIYFSLFSQKSKICSHIIAAYLYLQGEKWLKEELKRNAKK